ncbi:phosphoribosyl-ATP pyrophosphohydrolase [Sphingomonas oligoaromativorans]|nr:phosphoribosyl-ATP pyrophosphohydrolase [Sphingomonas oligoaromativorans]
MADTLDRLVTTIAARRQAEPGSSYVASLFAKGLPKIAQKVGEEAVESVIAALSGDARALTGEAADLIFHLLVLLEAGGVPFADVLTELDRREGVSGLDEKASRTAEPRPLGTKPAGSDDGGPSLSFRSRPDTRPLIRRG